MATVQALLRHYALKMSKAFPATRSRVRSIFSNNREFGLNGLDSKVISAIGKRNGYYIEIGANDGILQSNTLQLELFHGWRGVLIEPVKSTFTKLRRNRNRLRNHLERAACVSFDYKDEFVELIYSGLMTTASQLESDIDDPQSHAQSGVEFIKPSEKAGALQRILVPACTMTAVLRRARSPQHIDFLSLDVEGAELEVLKGIDFSHYTIDWILVESRNLARISNFLESQGYTIHSQLSGHDYLFHLNSRR